MKTSVRTARLYIRTKNVKIKVYKTRILSVILYGSEFLVSYDEGRTQTDSIWKQGAEGNNVISRDGSIVLHEPLSALTKAQLGCTLLQ